MCSLAMKSASCGRRSTRIHSRIWCPCATIEDVNTLKAAVGDVRMSEELKRYVVALTGATRTASGVQLGASPRASIALMKAAQAAGVL